MQVSDKLIKPLTEIKYLNADNVSRYRCIMRIFFENYEKLKYWLYQEDIYEEMIKDPYFVEYKPEQCQQDLAMLVEWRDSTRCDYGLERSKMLAAENFNCGKSICFCNVVW